MAIKIFTNTAFYDAAYSGKNTHSTVNTLSFAQGPRHLYWETTDTEETLVYQNNEGNLVADAFVMVRADKQIGHGVEVRSWSASGGAQDIQLVHPGKGTVSSDTFATILVPGRGVAAQVSTAAVTEDTKIFDTDDFQETLVGPEQQDWVYEFTERASRAKFGITLQNGDGGAYTKQFHQCFFANTFEFDHAELGVTERAAWETVQISRYQPYRIEERLTCTFTNITAAEIDSFNALPKINEEPFFIYDEDSIWLSDKLWHVILPSRPIVQQFDDVFSLAMELYRIRHYA